MDKNMLETLALLHGLYSIKWKGGCFLCFLPSGPIYRAEHVIQGLQEGNAG